MKLKLLFIIASVFLVTVPLAASHLNRLKNFQKVVPLAKDIALGATAAGGIAGGTWSLRDFWLSLRAYNIQFVDREGVFSPSAYVRRKQWFMSSMITSGVLGCIFGGTGVFATRQLAKRYSLKNLVPYFMKLKRVVKK